MNKVPRQFIFRLMSLAAQGILFFISTMNLFSNYYIWEHDTEKSIFYKIQAKQFPLAGRANYTSALYLFL